MSNNKKRRVSKSLFKLTLLKKGVNFFSKNISLKVVDGEYGLGVRFGVSVPKKEVKIAVKRNLLKRKALSILRKITNNKDQNFICLFFLKKEALDIPYQKLQDEIFFLLKKAKIISF